MTGRTVAKLGLLVLLPAAFVAACGGDSGPTGDADDVAPAEDGSGVDADAATDADVPGDVETDAADESTADADTVADVDGQAEAVVCELAPSCAGAGAPPVDAPHVPDLDVPAKSTDPADCEPARLRIALRNLTVHDALDGASGDLVYCIVQAAAAGGSELRVTPLTPSLADGESHAYGLDHGVVWGHDPAFADPGGDLLLTYDCVENDDTTAYEGLVTAIGDAASAVGGRLVDGAWVFDASGVTGPIVSAALAVLSGDDAVFHAQQTMPRSAQLELTNGGTWTVRRAGSAGPSTWDWELSLLVWGCVDNGR